VEFAEKKDNESAWINGGFMVLDKKVIPYIS
jgi:NDP-sugar pyrophosphorylase family protein